MVASGVISQRLGARRLVELLGDWRDGGVGYEELSGSIALLVRDGAIQPGTVLPAERQLAEALGVSRTTVSAGYRRLREARVALSRQGSGTVVRARPAGPSGTEEPGAGGAIDLTVACPEPWGGLPELGALALAGHPEVFAQRGYDTIGRPDLRAEIAARYAARGLPTSPEQIMVTLGAQHAIFLIARTILGRGDRSLIEAPSYPHAREALAATGALIAEVPVGEGAAAARLDTVRRVSPRLAYLIPDHHNPTGESIPEADRAALIAAFAERGSLVIADETTAELTLGGARSVRPFAAAAEGTWHADAVVTVGSLGKTVWGGLRIGWIRASTALIERFEASRRTGDLGTGAWEQVLALRALERYDEILTERSTQLTARHRVLREQLAAHLPGWRSPDAEGGVSLWVDLGEPRSSALCRESARRGVRLAPGPRFGAPGVFERFVRLPFTAQEDELVAAIGTLAESWTSRSEAGSGGSLPGAGLV
ncbi:PLP-dependent aminotransferase family protein [Leucobacter sp. CSA2]|uniref:PLP-dependent aminotransferase family protein n=1 Tax=Leucobacter edaphi TaxID=2796472 RepID=A0A934UX16_9MICO|nr:PLP-dependent aminotransferase family protein [Leucobacter edaphi]MBK0420843.1 PLP-dependent aminotransferase family protein [Leucobacter edaphi]